MKFICHSSWEQLPDSANVLFEQAQKDSLFFSRPWFENFTSIALDEDQMMLACVVAENKVLAILPLTQSSGNCLYSLKHRYTTHFTLLLADDNQKQVLTCLVQGLSQLPFKGLLLEPIAENDNKLTALQQVMETNGYSCERLFRFYNWIYHVQGQSYEDYIADRPSRLRNTISRKKRKLEREHGYKISLFSGDDVPQAMSDYYSAYTSSWKANEQYTDFVNGIVDRFSKPGWSRLAVLYVNEQPVAAQLWFVLHGKANIFRLAYDEAWKSYSVGSILTSFLMEYVIDIDKVDEIDFLTGNDAYKQDWMSDRRERFALSCVNNIKSADPYKIFVEWLKRILKNFKAQFTI